LVLSCCPQASSGSSWSNHLDFAWSNCWKATDQSSFTLTPLSGELCGGFRLYMKRGGDCDSVYSNTVITGPTDESRDLPDKRKRCKIDESDMQKQEDLLEMGVFRGDSSSTGVYKVRSSANLWAMDVCAEFGQADRGFEGLVYPWSALIFIFVGLFFCCFLLVMVECKRLKAGGGGSSSGSSFGDAIEDREEKTEAVETLHAEIDQLDLANLAEAVETMHAKLDQLTASVAKIVEGTTELAKACAKLDAAVSEAMEGDRPEPGATSIEELA